MWCCKWHLLSLLAILSLIPTDQVFASENAQNNAPKPWQTNNNSSRVIHPNTASMLAIWQTLFVSLTCLSIQHMLDQTCFPRPLSTWSALNRCPLLKTRQDSPFTRTFLLKTGPGHFLDILFDAQKAYCAKRSSLRCNSSLLRGRFNDSIQVSDLVEGFASCSATCIYMYVHGMQANSDIFKYMYYRILNE